MARFYGTVQGNRGRATRLGHSDLTVTAQSYAGDVNVAMWRDQNTDEEWVRIVAEGHQTGNNRHVLYNGKVKDLLCMNWRDAQIKALGMDSFVKRFEEQAA